MVNVNFWFTPRSRSTAMLRCLSNIPGSKVLFEKFCWSLVTDNAPDTIAMFGIEIDPSVTYEKILDEWRNTKCDFKIMKDLSIAVHEEDKAEILDEDSINIFIVRSPAHAATSYLPSAEISYYEIITSSGAFDFTMTYQNLLDTYLSAVKKCKKPPMIISGSVLCSKEKSIKALKKICELLEVEFSESMLTWESLDGFDPTWDVAYLAAASDSPLGFFIRANKSTCFEDSKEREVNMEEVRESNEQMADDIERCDKVYEEILKYATNFD